MSGDTAGIRSRPGEPSRVFSGLVGQTVPSHTLVPSDLLIDPARYPSEGDWAFCRFDDERIPALRLSVSATTREPDVKSMPRLSPLPPIDRAPVSRMTPDSAKKYLDFPV